VRTDAGTLLAFAEARTSPSCADRGAIDIVVRRSTNEGRTWGPIRVVLSGSGTDSEAPYTRGNPTPVVDRKNDRIHLLSTAEPATPGGTGPRREAIVQTSADDGLTFSAPRTINRLLPYPAPDPTSPPPLKGWFGTGPAHGIQLKGGPHPGRLVVGAYQSPDDTHQHAGVLYSDDFGLTWQPGQSANSYAAGLMKPGEAAVAELPSGRVYVGARNELSDKHRAYAITKEDGTSTPAFKSLPVTTANTQGSLLTLEQTYDENAGDTLLMAAPSKLTDRADLRLYAWNTNTSPKDAGTGDPVPTWQPVGDIVKPGKSGYSDLAELTGGEIGLVYESGNLPGMTGGEDWSAATINFRRVDPRTLFTTPNFTYTKVGQPASGISRPAAPTTPDASPHANDAYFTGDAKLDRESAAGQGLVLDGNGDSADVPYASSLDPKADDFTYSLRFKHDPAMPDSSQAVLLWAYGKGPDSPQVWIRTDAKANQVTAHVQGTTGAATVSVPVAGLGDSTDNKWHDVTLVRDEGVVTLWVNGTSVKSTSTVSGPVTKPVAGGNGGIRIGARLDDGYTPFRGSIDDVRFHRAALDPTRIGQSEHLGLWLPFHVVDRTDPVTLRDIPISDDVSGACVEGAVAGCVDGMILGGVIEANRLGDAAVDKGALKVNATYPGVETPFRPGIDVGSGAFTYALWFKHSSTTSSANQVLLWAYGVDPDGADPEHWAPSLWARVEPSQNRIRAWAETAPGQGVERIISAPAGLGDNEWHLLTLIRDETGFRLGVDRQLTDPVPLAGEFEFPAGSGTAPDGTALEGTTPLGLRVGSKPGVNGTEAPLSGAIDDVRLYGRALSQTEIDRLLPTPTPENPKPPRVFPADKPRFRWSMEPGNVQKHSVMRPAPTGRSTPDSSAHANNAYIDGGTDRPGGGRFGKAFRANGFPGTDGKVVLPYTDSEDLGSGDFTVATVFSHDPNSSATQSIAWAYGDGPSERQLRIRVEERTEKVNGADVKKRKLVAFAQTDTDSTEIAVDTPGAGWHHVALTRKGSELRLYIDGKELFETDADGIRKAKKITGSLTYPDAFDVQGFLLGDSPFGGQPLKGSLDEFRLYRMALDGPDIAALWSTNTNPAQGRPVVHLPFDVIAAGEYARM
jgi:sialidase-1